MIVVCPKKRIQNVVPVVGSVVTAHVIKITPRVATVSIVAVNDIILKEPFSGTIRSSDVR